MCFVAVLSFLEDIRFLVRGCIDHSDCRFSVDVGGWLCVDGSVWVVIACPDTALLLI